MDELKKQVNVLIQAVDQACRQLSIDELSNELDGLKKTVAKQDFWSNSARAQTTMQTIAKLENRVKPWRDLQNSLKEAKELLALNDTSLESELSNQIKKNSEAFSKLKQTLKFNGPYDDHDAVVSIYAGAGGTDAQDWAQMLARMYSRFSEKEGWRVVMLEETPGEEAGIKSLTFTIHGDYAYGKLKGEHGVHRLVRLSPYNADNLRQTSFAKVEVMPKIDAPDEILINDKDIKVDVYRSGGHGGQSVNTTDSAVRVTHLPTGISVAIQNERSQLQNKDTAMTILRSRLAQLQLEQHQDHLEDLKGPNQSAEWGNQIRSYVLHPYKQVKDLRTRYETSDPGFVLEGNLEPLIDAYLEYTLHL
jgi:peptide chain release factor 2